jgi:hypothetical protein
LADRTPPHDANAASADPFGHPKGLTFLFTTEMWERFSYYGMRALLVLYMTKYLLLPGHANKVIGLFAVQRALESFFGPLDIQPLASQIYGFHTALVYFTPIFGGLLADRVLGQRRTVVIGAILMAIGHFMMASEHLYLFALTALSRQWCLQAEYWHSGWRPLRARGSASRPRLFDLLCRERRPQHRALQTECANPDHVVPRHQPVPDFCLHPVHRYALDAAGGARQGAIDHH